MYGDAVVLIFSSQLQSTLKGLLVEDASVSATTGLVDNAWKGAEVRIGRSIAVVFMYLLSTGVSLLCSSTTAVVQWRHRIQP